MAESCSQRFKNLIDGKLLQSRVERLKALGSGATSALTVQVAMDWDVTDKKLSVEKIYGALDGVLVEIEPSESNNCPVEQLVSDLTVALEQRQRDNPGIQSSEAVKNDILNSQPTRTSD